MIIAILTALVVLVIIYMIVLIGVAIAIAIPLGEPRTMRIRQTSKSVNKKDKQ
jgi:hypothetical protein